MTVPDQPSSVSYTGNGVTNAYSTGFIFFANNTVVVSVNQVDQTDGVDYTLSGGAGLAGTVTFLSGHIPSNGSAITIYRNVPYSQEAEFLPFDGNPTEVTEGAFD